MKNLKTFAKANETLTTKAMKTVQGGAEGQNPLTETFTISARPSSVTRGGTITLSVESTGDSMFFEWMTDNFE